MNLTQLSTYPEDEVRSLFGLLPPALGELLWVALHKKPRGGELTPEQKEANRQFASRRVRVEHGIRRIKAFRIVRDAYRLGTGLFGMIACATVGLVQLLRFAG